MAIDINRDELLPFKRASREIPSARGEGGIHVATLYRWAQRGVRGHRLESVLVGGVRMTTRRAIQAFIEKLSNQEGEGPDKSVVSPRPATPGNAHLDAAERELDAEGVV